MNNYKAMTLDEWIDEFKPIVNHINDKAEFALAINQNGLLYKTYGTEQQYIKDILSGKIEGLSDKNIWTFVNGEQPELDSEYGIELEARGYLYDEEEDVWSDESGEEIPFDLFSNGYHVANRIGYFITEVAIKDNEEIEVFMHDDLADIVNSQMSCKNSEVALKP